MTNLDLHAAMVERCRRLAPALEERAAEGERLRMVPEQSIRDLAEAGVFSMLAPTTHGGPGLGLSTVAQATRELAHGCPATAWTASFFALHTWMLSSFPPLAQEEAFAGRAEVLAPGALSPTGTLTPVDGGFRLDGRWAWATGVMHSDWVIVTGIAAVDGALDIRLCLLPRSDVEVEDTWHMAGMKATGSNDIVAADAFVPTHRTIAISELMTGDPTQGSDAHPQPFMRHPLQPVLVLVAAAPALGAAERCVELFRERMATRVLAYTLGDKQADQPAAQIRLASAMASVEAARAVWERAITRVEAVDHGAGMSLSERASARLAAAHTVRLAREAINTVCEAAGASAYAESSPLQRLQRDVKTLKGHVVFDWDRTAELVGRTELGLAPRPGDLL